MATKTYIPNPDRLNRLRRRLAECLRRKAESSFRPISLCKLADDLDRQADIVDGQLARDRATAKARRRPQICRQGEPGWKSERSDER